MRRAPRDAAAAIVDRPLGDPARRSPRLSMAALALGIVAWGEHRYDLVVATTMGLTTLSLHAHRRRARVPRADRHDLQRATRSRTGASSS